MVEILLAVIIVILVVAVGFLISSLIELRRSAKETIRFLKRNEEAFNAVLTELREVMKAAREITENISGFTEDARVFSSSIADVGRNLKSASELVGDLSTKAAGSVSGIRVGVRTALEVLIKNLLKRGGSQ
jgi:uncharacterized protein YoxC